MNLFKDVSSGQHFLLGCCFCSNCFLKPASVYYVHTLTHTYTHTHLKRNLLFKGSPEALDWGERSRRTGVQTYASYLVVTPSRHLLPITSTLYGIIGSQMITGQGGHIELFCLLLILGLKLRVGKTAGFRHGARPGNPCS